MELFAFLLGISPWWWVALAVVLGAFEMATMSFFLIWPALAAALIALLLVAAPLASGATQIAAFAILSIVFTIIGRKLLHRVAGDKSAAEKLNSRSNLMIGRQGEVIEFTGPEGVVVIDGIHWRALWPVGVLASSGDTVSVEKAEGMTLYIQA